MRQIIQLFSRTLAKAKLPKAVLRRIGAAIEYDGLGRTAVAVEIARLRVARRPSRRLVVPQIEHVLLHDAANRIAPVERPPYVVPLLPVQYMIVSRIDAAASSSREHIAQASTHRRLHPRFIPRQPR